MKKGGYQILDLRNLPLTNGEAANVKGTYAQLANAGGKRIVVSGLNVGDTVYNDFGAYFTESEGTYTGAVTIGGATITIVVASGDDVTVTTA